ncbi:MAG: helix-turn-helix domain-containing protein [archaeon]
MIVKEDFLKKLRAAFDLNIYEVKIWTALLSKGIATAGELSDISDVPRSRSYDVLESLEKKSFVIMKIGKPIKYIAVKPLDIIIRVKKGLQEKTNERIMNIEGVKETNVYTELDLLYKQGIQNVDAASLSASLKGRSNIYDQLESMLRDAKKSVIIMTTEDGLLRKSEIIKSIKHLKNIDVKIIVPETKKAKEIAQDLKNVNVKFSDNINARFCVVDETHLLFMMTKDNDVHESYDTGIWVNTPYFASALKNLFEFNWNNIK